MFTASLSTAGPLLAGALLQSSGIASTWLVLSGMCVLAVAFLMISLLVVRWRAADVPPRLSAEPVPVPADRGGPG
jgi:hypothetical protein